MAFGFGMMAVFQALMPEHGDEGEEVEEVFNSTMTSLATTIMP